MPEIKLTDDQLIEQIKGGDRKAFRMLFDRYYSTMLGTAVNMLKDMNSAKDISQEVFLQIWKNRKTLKIQSSLSAYLKRAVINRALNQIKARKNFAEEEQLLAMPSQEIKVEEKMAAEDLEKALYEALNTLPERCRLIFILKRIEGLSLKEIAEKLDISPKTVENQITKALKVLKEVLQ